MDAIPLLLAGLLLVVLVPGLVGVVMPALRPALVEEGIDPDGVVSGVRAVWDRWWWVPLLLAIGLSAVKVCGWFLRRRDGRRAELLKAIAGGLDGVMPRGWSAEQQLQPVRWRGTELLRLRIHLTPQCPDTDVEWRMALTAALRFHMGQLGRIAWPSPPGRGRRRIDIRQLRSRRLPFLQSGGPAAAGDVPPGDSAEMEERVVRALAGLVPKPEPKVRFDGEGQQTITVGYGETTRDQSMHWRARVVDQVSGRLGMTFRATWDRQRRMFTLAPVPPLPEVVRWSDQVRKLRELQVGPYVAGYGTDEDGNTVAWEPGDREPHAMINGEPGSGKTESMKSLLNSLLLAGCLVAIIDPKKIDYSAYLGRPGVVCVATSMTDMVGALVDLLAEVHRRTSAKALVQLREQYPHLADGELPPQAAIDKVPLIIFFDELSVFVSDAEKWWRSMTKEERREWGSESTNPPFRDIPSDIVALARAISIHLCVGTQRADARNFGDATTMRDNIKHMGSMGRLSAIGSEMQWGDRSVGRDVEITDDVGGIGVSNGLRISPDGRRLGRGIPGRFKAWYAGGVADSESFWADVAEVAPDASLIRLPHVSDASRDPAAAARQLRLSAYGPEPSIPARPPETATEEVPVPSAVPPAAGSATDGERREEDAALLHRAAALVVSEQKASAAALQRGLKIGSARAQEFIEQLEALGVVGPYRRTKPRTVLVDAQQLSDLLPGDVPSTAGVIPAVSPHPIPPTEPAVTEVDRTGTGWEAVAATRVTVGDIVVVGDLEAAEVVEEPRPVEDSFDGGELVRLVILVDGEEQVVDLDETEAVYRRAA